MNNQPEIHQFLPVLDRGDAIGNYTMEIQNLLRHKGFRSEIFVWRAGKGQKKYCRHYFQHKKFSSAANIMIYHFSVCCPITSYFSEAPDRKIIIYHNITPKEFFIGVSDEVYYITKSGRKEIGSLKDKVELALCDSEFNRQELLSIGYKNVVVSPVMLNFGKLDASPDATVTSKYKDDWVNFLFVGRIAPNKKQEDLIRIFYYYKKYINEKSRLFIVGVSDQVPQYQTILENLVARLGLKDVIFAGRVNDNQLVAYYQLTDIFLCMSEHEGFCVPLIEAMHFQKPIVSYNSTAIADTLGNSGVVFSTKNHQEVAEMTELVLRDEELKRQIIAKQNERLKYFRRENTEKIFVGHIKNF